MAKRKIRKRVLTRHRAVRPRVVRRKPIGSKLIDAVGHDTVREVLSAVLIIGILYFSIQGTMFLVLRTDSPLRAVSSNSMKPTFERGDMLLLTGVHSSNEIKIGDIIVYQDLLSNKQIVHRIVGITVRDNQVEITTKGDANPNNDQPITFEQVRGKVIFWIPKLGYLSLWLQGD